MLWNALAVKILPPLPPLLVDHTKKIKNFLILIQKIKSNFTRYFHRNKIILLHLYHSLPIMKLFGIKYYYQLPFCPFWKYSLNIRDVVTVLVSKSIKTCAIREISFLRKIIPLRYFVCCIFHLPWLLCTAFSFRKLLVNHEHANKFDNITIGMKLMKNKKKKSYCFLQFYLDWPFNLRLKLWKSLTRKWYNWFRELCYMMMVINVLLGR